MEIDTCEYISFQFDLNLHWKRTLSFSFGQGKLEVAANTIELLEEENLD